MGLAYVPHTVLQADAAGGPAEEKSMKITRLIAAGAMAAAAALTISACSSGTAGSDAAETDAPFRVVAVLPVTGPLAKQSEVQIEGLKASAKIVNANGGIG